MDWGDSVHLGELVGCGGREERWWPLKSVEALGQVALVPQPRRAFSHYFTLMLIDILSRYTLGLILTDDYWMRVAEKCYICIFKKLLLRKWMEPPSNYSYKNLGHKENLKYSSLFCWKKKKDVSWMVMLGLGFPSGLVVKKKKSVCQCRRHRFDPWVRRSPWRRKWQPTPVFLPGESHGRGSLVSYSVWGHKESDMTEHAHVCVHTHTHTYARITCTCMHVHTYTYSRAT